MVWSGVEWSVAYMHWKRQGIIKSHNYKYFMTFNLEMKFSVEFSGVIRASSSSVFVHLTFQYSAFSIQYFVIKKILEKVGITMHCNLRLPDVAPVMFTSLITKPVAHQSTKFQRHRAVRCLVINYSTRFLGPFFIGRNYSSIFSEIAKPKYTKLWEDIDQSPALS